MYITLLQHYNFWTNEANNVIFPFPEVFVYPTYLLLLSTMHLQNPDGVFNFENQAMHAKLKKDKMAHLLFLHSSLQFLQSFLNLWMVVISSWEIYVNLTSFG